MTEPTTETPLQLIERLKREAAEKRSEAETQRKAIEEDSMRRTREGAERILREVYPHAILDSGILLRHEYSLLTVNPTQAAAYLCIPLHLPIHLEAEVRCNPKQVAMSVSIYDDQLSVVTAEKKTEWWTATPDYGKVLLWAAEGFARLQREFVPNRGVSRNFSGKPVTEWLYHQLCGMPALTPRRVNAVIDVHALDDADAVRRLGMALQQVGIIRATAVQA